MKNEREISLKMGKILKGVRECLCMHACVGGGRGERVGGIYLPSEHTTELQDATRDHLL